ncbi:reverse transcriptase domain-containing protein, partial [Tanacetum coccineum]
ADQLLHHKVEGRVDGLVEEVEELGNQQAELVDELVIKMVKEVSEVTERMEALTKSLTSPWSSLIEAIVHTRIFWHVTQRTIRWCVAYTRWTKKMELVKDMSGCGDNKKVKYTGGSFIDKALTWWNTHVQTRGWEAIVGMTWEDFKSLMREEFCPNNEIQKLETEF